MKRYLLSYLAGSPVWHACGFRYEMDFLRVAFEGDNSRVCRVALKGGRP